MKQVPDHKKLRREYLDKRREAISAIRTFLIAACACVGMICFFVSTLKYDNSSNTRGAAIVLVFILVGGMVMHIRCARHYMKELKEVDRQYYVPPTDKHAPAEILLRGSEEPPVEQSEVLLRAAQEHETAKEELLRAIRKDGWR
jgi:hypothetical protein